MKPLKTLAALAAVMCAAALPAVAQQYELKSFGAATNYAAETTNSITSAKVTLTKHDLTAVEVSFNLDGSGTSAVVVKVHESLDGTNFDDTVLQSISLTASGTNTVRAIVPLNVGAVGYLGVRSLENPNASGITNLVIRAAIKPKREG